MVYGNIPPHDGRGLEVCIRQVDFRARERGGRRFGLVERIGIKCCRSSRVRIEVYSSVAILVRYPDERKTAVEYSDAAPHLRRSIFIRRPVESYARRKC